MVGATARFVKNINPALNESVRANLYESVLGILGASGVIFPVEDAKHSPTATTFTTVGNQQDTFTWSKDPETFDTAPGTRGLVPVVTFDGVDEEADTPDNAFYTDAGPVSYGAWINLATVAGNIIIAKWDETTGAEAREFKLFTDSNGDVGLQIYDETNNAGIGRKIDTALTADTWIFVVGTHTGGTDATDIIMYKDGVASDDGDIVDDAGFANMVNTATVVSLCYEESTAGAKANFFDGIMAGGPLGPFVSSQELTADEVLRLYEVGRRALGL